MVPSPNSEKAPNSLAMRYGKTWVLCMFVLINVLISAPTQAEISYLVQRDNHTLIIVGTIHMGSGPETRLRSETQEHIYSSDKVYLELASSDLAGAYFRMMREGRRSGSPLSETLEPDLWKAFSSFTQSYGLPGATIDTLEMWVISILLTPQIATKAGFKAQYGIEAGLYSILARADIQGYGLESVDDQLNAIRNTLANKSDAEIARSLMNEGVDSIQELRELELTWRAGDLDGLMDAIYISASHNELAWLLDHRNIAWFDYLQDSYGHRESPIKLFIAVGAGHLGGETGLLQLFADAGYEVTPLHAD